MSVAGPVASGGGGLLEALELVGGAERVADGQAEQRTESRVVGGARLDMPKARDLDRIPR